MRRGELGVSLMITGVTAFLYIWPTDVGGKPRDTWNQKENSQVYCDKFLARSKPIRVVHREVLSSPEAALVSVSRASRHAKDATSKMSLKSAMQ